MMHLYIITFLRTYENSKVVERDFYCYAETKQKAINRFCSTTDIKKSFIKTIREVE